MPRLDRHVIAGAYKLDSEFGVHRAMGDEGVHEAKSHISHLERTTGKVTPGAHLDLIRAHFNRQVYLQMEAKQKI